MLNDDEVRITGVPSPDTANCAAPEASNDCATSSTRGTGPPVTSSRRCQMGCASRLPRRVDEVTCREVARIGASRTDNRRAPPSSDCTTIRASSQVSPLLREREEQRARLGVSCGPCARSPASSFTRFSGTPGGGGHHARSPDLAHTGSCRRMPSSRPTAPLTRTGRWARRR